MKFPPPFFAIEFDIMQTNCSVIGKAHMTFATLNRLEKVHVESRLDYMHCYLMTRLESGNNGNDDCDKENIFNICIR